MSESFREMLEVQWACGNFVCVGLDSEFDKIPDGIRLNQFFKERRDVENVIAEVNRAIVEATHDLVCAYKPNAAFYEAYGDEGWRALRTTVRHIHDVAPHVPVILDAKRADIGNTNLGYVRMAFEDLGVDAITVHPYLGGEALLPFFALREKGIFVLCRTSNPGAGELQGARIMTATENVPLYLYVARLAAERWNRNGNCGLVVGATALAELAKVREIVCDIPILIPGIGAQGGDLEKAVAAGKDSRGWGMIINSSRGVIFASSGADFAEAARRETEKLRDAINRCLEAV